MFRTLGLGQAAGTAATDDTRAEEAWDAKAQTIGSLRHGRTVQEPLTRGRVREEVRGRRERRVRRKEEGKKRSARG